MFTWIKCGTGKKRKRDREGKRNREEREYKKRWGAGTKWEREIKRPKERECVIERPKEREIGRPKERERERSGGNKNERGIEADGRTVGIVLGM